MTPSSKSRSTSRYNAKRSFDETSEPQSSVEGDVDPLVARPGKSFVIQQHHATRLHFDLRLEMFNGKVPVLVSWAVPRGLPQKRGVAALAIHVEDHPYEYRTFSGSIPKGNYGGGDVRIFDHGTYEVVERTSGKLTVRMLGKRIQGVYHIVKTKKEDEWRVLLKTQELPESEPPPSPKPMLATLVGEPFDDEKWAFEPKWDGVRAIAVCEHETKLITRNLLDVTIAYPELAKLHEQVVALNAMLDGEIVAMVDGKPSFQALQRRMHVRKAADIERLSKKTPVIYIAFDILYLDGRSLVDEPFEKRRELLEEAIVTSGIVEISPNVIGGGTDLFKTASEQELEGIVAKRLSSKYELGKRSPNWKKIKTVFDGDFVVVGWTEGEGRREGTIGALVLGAFEDGHLQYVGSVGTGFDSRSLDYVLDELGKREVGESAFDPDSVRKMKKDVRHARWVRPELVASVEYRQLTDDYKLRAPSFKGLREDKRAEECTLDELPGR
jgi:bifunctional non-homologous end joining protein LigD